MRVFVYLCAQHARRAALGFGCTWAAVTLALAAALRLELPGALTTGAWPELLALAFGPALTVAMPLSVVAHALRLAESGETLAVVAGGVRPVVLPCALLTPWLPLLVALDLHADTFRPAAVAALGERAARALHAEPAGALRALHGAGIAGSRHGDGLRFLLPVGDRVVGIELFQPPPSTAADGQVSVGAGRVHLVGAAGQPPLELGFDSASLFLPLPRRALGTLAVDELSTDFVAARGARIERARALQRRAPLRDEWPRERRRRELVAPCAALALLFVAAATTGRRAPSPVRAWLGFGLPTVALATLGAGVFAAW